MKPNTDWPWTMSSCFCTGSLPPLTLCEVCSHVKNDKEQPSTVFWASTGPSHFHSNWFLPVLPVSPQHVWTDVAWLLLWRGLPEKQGFLWKTSQGVLETSLLVFSVAVVAFLSGWPIIRAGGISTAPFPHTHTHNQPPPPLPVAASEYAPSLLHQGQLTRTTEGAGGEENGRRSVAPYRDNFSWAALFKVKAWFAFQKRQPGCLATSGMPSGPSPCRSNAAAPIQLMEDSVIDHAAAVNLHVWHSHPWFKWSSSALQRDMIENNLCRYSNPNWIICCEFVCDLIPTYRRFTSEVTDSWWAEWNCETPFISLWHRLSMVGWLR